MTVTEIETKSEIEIATVTVTGIETEIVIEITTVETEAETGEDGEVMMMMRVMVAALLVTALVVEQQLHLLHLLCSHRV